MADPKKDDPKESKEKQEPGRNDRVVPPASPAKEWERRSRDDDFAEKGTDGTGPRASERRNDDS